MSDLDPQAVGRIEGKLDMVLESQREVRANQRRLDDRLRHVEKRVALNASVVSGFVAAGMSLLVAKLRTMVG